MADNVIMATGIPVEATGEIEMPQQDLKLTETELGTETESTETLSNCELAKWIHDVDLRLQSLEERVI